MFDIIIIMFAYSLHRITSSMIIDTLFSDREGHTTPLHTRSPSDSTYMASYSQAPPPTHPILAPIARHSERERDIYT